MRHILNLTERAISYRLPHMPNEKEKQEQQLLWNAALKAIGGRLRRDLQPEQDVPDRFRDLIAQLEANSPPADK